MPASPSPPNESESFANIPPPETGPKLLFDENLASRLVRLLVGEYPASSHADSEGLKGSPDTEIWEFARSGNYVLVTKDDDFQRLSVANGFPPKVVWIRLGNCSTSAVADLL